MTNSRGPTRDQDEHLAPALELLLDEYWFFSNTLGNNRSSRSTRTKDKEPQQEADEKVEVEDDDLNWSSIYEGVLRSRIAEETTTNSSSSSSNRSTTETKSLLHRAPSMPLTASSAAPSPSPTTTAVPRRLTHSHSMLLERNCHRRNPKVDKQQLRLFQSSRDLESMEVQGFKDLGFVFDKEELRESLADVLPGLRGGPNNQAQAQRVRRPRPYLSEAWQGPVVMKQKKQQSSESEMMKDKLRMWAQAVACNVRHEQEC